jgi:predicted transposase/invertase (TIGR01784 family)
MNGEKFHDRGYKALFSHPRMVEELIRSFVREEFVQDIDFSTLERTFDSFVTEEFRERETDIIWNVRVKKSRVYFYILIEFQSTVDRFMALRLLSYLLLFYLELVKDERIREERRLPAVFPVLLYSGDDTWTAAQSIDELIAAPSRFPPAFVPSFRYYKIAENEFGRESLELIDNLVSRLFLIETAEVERIAEVVTEAVEVLKREVDPELQRNFGLWLRRLFEKRRIDVDIDIVTMTAQEVRTMLEANLQKYEERLIAKGRIEGRAEGRVERDREVARDMKNLGLGTEMIMKVTGLSAEDIEKS